MMDDGSTEARSAKGQPRLNDNVNDDENLSATRASASGVITLPTTDDTDFTEGASLRPRLSASPSVL